MSSQNVLELIILVSGVSIVFAGKKLPAIMRSIAKGLREFKWDSGYVEVDR